jgi:hypothetical protein
MPTAQSEGRREEWILSRKLKGSRPVRNPIFNLYQEPIFHIPCATHPSFHLFHKATLILC